MTTPAPAATPGGPRRRKPPRLVEVVSVSPVSARLISVLVTGDELDGFADAAPTSHLKVFLPVEGEDAPNLPAPGPD
ncbi:MAG TPA: siderophore-interacting protein, partial [Trebonia sp.]|nr:siderophore-interacting protein [Trebonia sp.]